MRKFLIIITIIFFSCKKSDESIKVYSWKEYIEAESKTPKKKIIVVDTICPYEIERAKKDIQKNKLVYYSYNYPEEVVNELSILLKPFNITARKATNSCIAPPNGFKENCYQNLMYETIEKKYSRKWIDSIEKVALKNYVIKNPDKPYIENGIDLRTKYLKK